MRSRAPGDELALRSRCSSRSHPHSQPPPLRTELNHSGECRAPCIAAGRRHYRQRSRRSNQCPEVIRPCWRMQPEPEPLDLGLSQPGRPYVQITGADGRPGLERHFRGHAGGRHRVLTRAGCLPLIDQQQPPLAAAASRRRRGSAPATTTPRRSGRRPQTGSSRGRSPAARGTPAAPAPNSAAPRPACRAATRGVVAGWALLRPPRRSETQPLSRRGQAAGRNGAEKCR